MEPNQGEISFLGQMEPFGWSQHGTVHFSYVNRSVQAKKKIFLQNMFLAV